VAVRSGLPLVPIAIRGTRSMLRSDVWFPRAGSIAVVIGAPLQATGEGDDWAEATALRDAARSFIARESGEPGA
jgi:1-acyl-sn-glycerol-3-phosphate acyltransferase